MLTGDENIVDVDVSVFWLVKTGGAGDYLFNIQNPEGTVKAVAESAMREVIGRSEIQPILTGARQSIETAVHDLMQKVLDTYQAGIQITQVQMQKVDPPAQVIDSFRDVQAARADLERAQNEAQTYANRVVPEARGRRRRSSSRPKPIASRPSPRRRARRRASARSMSNTRRRRWSRASASIWRRWSACSAAPTRSSSISNQQGSNSGNVVPILPLNEMLRRTPERVPVREAPDEARYRRRRPRRSRRHRRHHRLRLAVHRLPDPACARGAARPAGARRHRAGAELQDRR